MRYISIDVEATGLDYINCDIIEFGAVLDDLSNPLPISQLPVFHTYFHKNTFVGEPGALAMHQEIFSRIDERKAGYTYLTAEKFGNTFRQFLIKHGYVAEKDRITINVAGKNFNSFDLQLLKNKTDFCKHIQPRAMILDPAILYYIPGDEKLPCLQNCLDRAGIDKTVSHCAIDDALDVVKLIRDKLVPNS